MHEFDIARALLRSTLGKMKEHRVERIAAVKLRLGRLNLLTPEMLQSAFDLVSKGTALEGVRLEVEEVEGSEVTVLQLTA